MIKKQTPAASINNHEEAIKKNILYLWCLRILIPCGGHKKFITNIGFSDDNTLELINMEKYADRSIKRMKIVRKFKAMHTESEKHTHTIPAALQENLCHIIERIPLNEVECDLLIFTIMIHTNAGLEGCADTLGSLDKSKLVRYLSIILNHDEREMSRALAMNGQLASSGLIKVDASWSHDIKRKLDLMDGLADNLLVPEVDIAKIFAGSFIEGIAPKLSAKAFQHAHKPYSLIKSYLKKTLAGTKAVNILIYGQPGTGKTEMVRTLVHHCGAKLFEISTEDGDGDPLSSSSRFSAYQLSQQLLRNTPKAVILFDEIEDVFPKPNRYDGVGNTEKKAWINRMLEGNSIPAFWLCNRVNHIDPAFLRRFDFVLEMPEPTIAMRKHIFLEYLHDIPVHDAWLQKISSNRNLLPAHIEKAAKVARHLASNDAVHNASVIENVLEGTQQILGNRKEHSTLDAATSYSLDCVSANINITKLVKGLQRNKRGCICFYGPPGTGKTALGRHIAETIDHPLIIKRASDIISMWVGGTEENIAAMFKQAKDEGGVLLLDEADSFLRDRRNANHTWEVSQVNELLVQMENFDGLFICSTNLMDNLDQASLRRFAIKVEFDYLSPAQAIQMLRKESTGRVTRQQTEKIARMDTLAPGDFATVQKKLQILGTPPTAKALIRELQAEVAIKQGTPSRRIGFTG
ncbi:MAG: ATP-binding protein [Mariprofundales bacterium]|nr:ATP-binding protein [Mariprofundales bacterium]